MNDDKEVALSEQVAQPQAKTSAVPPAQQQEAFDKQRWGDAVARSDLLTAGEKVILAATLKCVDWKTAETFVRAESIAAKVGHQVPTRVWDAWKKAAALQMMTRPYAKPNEGKRHYR